MKSTQRSSILSRFEWKFCWENGKNSCKGEVALFQVANVGVVAQSPEPGAHMNNKNIRPLTIIIH